MIALMLLAMFIGELFRAYTVFFFILWLIVPIIALLIRYNNCYLPFSKKLLALVLMILLGISITVSFVVFAHFDKIRDKVGYENIKGYQSEYSPAYDDYGRSVTDVEVYTSHWFGRVFLWGFEWTYIILCIGLPIVTYMQYSAIRKLHNEKQSEQT